MITRLPQLLAQPWRDDAGDHVDAAAGDEWHDDLDRLIGIVLSLGGVTDADCEQHRGTRKNTSRRPRNSHPTYLTIEDAPQPPRVPTQRRVATPTRSGNPGEAAATAHFTCFAPPDVDSSR
jgi:hypothetical protein